MKHEDWRVLQAMHTYGGGFVRKLADAAFSADEENLRRLKATWPEYWREYEQLADRLDKQESARAHE